ncbi:MAG: carbohydrate ABC transporter permease [Anaerolineae bacterium]|nr:carbohydrate ABC transporter permease [Anaerolineae bacterium]MDW8099217.1 carbohydrate ABC transporter permease [Anaerolineae bacterium]
MAITASSRRKRQWHILIPKIIIRFWVYVLLVIFAVIFVFPFYTMFVGSFMQDSELFSRYPNLWPKRGFDLTSYRQLFAELNYGRPLFNSFVVATGRMLGSLFFCSLAGFAFAKRRFPGRDKLFFFMLTTMMLPTQITLIPWYLLMVKYLKWGNTFLPLWIPVWASAFGIFLMRQFIASSVPDEMLEAATIDGASVFGMFIRVVLPIITPGLAVLAILTFVEGFNDFLGPLLVLSDSRMFTAPLALANFKGSTIIAPRYSLMFAGSVLATVPLLIIFFAFQRQLISGILSGAIKGGG